MNTELVSFKDLQKFLNVDTPEAVKNWLIKYNVPFKPSHKGVVTTATAINKAINDDFSGPRVIKTKSQ